ncbi:MAG: inorganic phosphate transporter [Gammaproteobacteria bacterium]|nr:MAG: inorganic phosphate transporter [Gammaproteobacteria bacterium]
MNEKNTGEIKYLSFIEGREYVKAGLALLFLAGVMMFALYGLGSGHVNIMLVVAAVIGGYMAMNIGANDVANNVGPAVGAGALTLGGAILIAALFESAGALLAGGEVVNTVKKGIIDPMAITSSDTFVWLMMAALLAGAIWLNIATALGAPVSTTHSIVGGVMGAGIAAAGVDIVNWGKMGAIAASWVISPVMGGLIAAAFLYLVKRTITYQENMLEAGKKVVPLLSAMMAWAFSTYLILKGLKKIWKVEFLTAVGLGALIAIAVYFIVRPMIAKAASSLKNDKGGVNQLFTMPLICSAALLSFAHGANDVANAVGPLAAINDVFASGGISHKAAIPLWVMMVGAVGIVIGLALYGPKLIRTVGSEITDLDKSRAFCVAMAAAITVIIASQLGLPVSSTHIAVGGIFGVGFLREYLKSNYQGMVDEIKHHQDGKPEAITEFITQFEAAAPERKKAMLKEVKKKSNKAHLSKKERKRLKKAYKNELVKRSHFLKIAGAWVITVPASAAMAGMLFYMIRGIMLP